jgi:membrane peptidoglycan carboxypeptidase
MRRALSPTRRRLGLGLLLLAAVVIALLTSAWIASPDATGLQTRVQHRLRLGTGRAVPLEAIAPTLRAAVVATEDERFYQHGGLDPLALLRALPSDLVHLSLTQGASTITEQLGKLLYLQGNDHDPWRKLEAAALALKLAHRYSKAQILAAYLNSAYFGENAYGIWAASERYFATTPRRLNTAQATLLAGLIQAPTAYTPLKHPAAARARQVEVLRSLARNGVLTPARASAVLSGPLSLRSGRPLAPVRAVDLTPGPAATWWQLGLGTVVGVAGLTALLLLRTLSPRPMYAVHATRLLSVALIVLGAVLAIRSFRSA